MAGGKHWEGRKEELKPRGHFANGGGKEGNELYGGEGRLKW
jgi:hypothetical protein